MASSQCEARRVRRTFRIPLQRISSRDLPRDQPKTSAVRLSNAKRLSDRKRISARDSATYVSAQLRATISPAPSSDACASRSVARAATRSAVRVHASDRKFSGEPVTRELRSGSRMSPSRFLHLFKEETGFRSARSALEAARHLLHLPTRHQPCAPRAGYRYPDPRI